MFISLLHRRTMLVLAKPVTWTLDPHRPHKAGSRYNDILSCIGKPKGSATMSQNSSFIPLLTIRFSAKTTLGYFYSPTRVAVTRVKQATLLTLTSFSESE